MSEIQQRIREFIDQQGITIKKFEETADLSNGFVQKVGSYIRDKSLEKVKKAYPNLNIEWLTSGYGEMLDYNSNTEIKSNSAPSINTDKKGVPYYDIDFVGGFDVMENNQTISPTYYIDFLPFNDADCWLNVTGKSMGPLIAHGDIVALKEVQDWQTFLLEGEMYAIVTFNGFRTIKIIGRDTENLDNYLLIPYNKNGDYHPQPIPKKVITKVF
jgi:hypothetical protein